ncbi:MAG TPA: hypothetical protein VM260_18910, partial [Pirellula sp.]|nr:hypothetical protein [Pirellula sp.]
MKKPFIFVSCGQVTAKEKQLGTDIVELVKKLTGFETFFAESVQDLAGLDSNILRALRDCSGFLTVLHPRGDVTGLDNRKRVRASVWIEQEIAIATYIQRVENRPLPVIAFIHKSVGREGLRDLLHLNPVPFEDEAEILAQLAEKLAHWTHLKAALTGVQLELIASAATVQDGHRTRRLSLTLINDTNSPIKEFDCLVKVPTGLLKHWSNAHSVEASSDDPSMRVFRLNQNLRPTILPKSKELLFTIDTCTHCAVDFIQDHPAIGKAIVAASKVEA